jgi:ATP-dependent exoDNAse (exonuclease V) beta subunit
MADRERAIDVTRSWIVEAPAGSGKTGLLIQRYLKLLALPSIEQPEQVIAVTFTLKATGEIRERIVKELERARGADNSKDEFDRRTRRLAAAVLERDRALSWGLLDHPRRLNVRTIDSICAEIARSLPVLSGSAGLVPLENANVLYQLAAERTLMQLGGEDHALSDALRFLLLHRDGNLKQLRDLLGEMLALRDQWGRLVPLGRELLDDTYLDGIVLEQIERVLEDVICTELTKLSTIMPSHILREISMLAGELGSNEGYQGQPSPIAVCGGIYSSPTQTAEDLERWQALGHLLINKDDWRPELGLNKNHLRFTIDRQQRTRLREIINQLRDRDDLLVAVKRVTTLPPARYPTEQWLVVKALLRVLYRALGELQLVFAERGQCDFVELGLLARAALRRDGGAFETAFGTDMQHMLVDEMQDTSTSQYELIELLTQGWDGRSQTVFLVGDPKQSIYLFRQARVERFIRMMQTGMLGELGLECLHLTANFRSQRHLVQTLNEDFSQLFPPEVDEEHLEEAPYVAAEPIRGPSIGDNPSVVWHTCVLPSGLSQEERRSAQRRQSRHEALQIRKIVEYWRIRPLPSDKDTWKIAVLVRNRRHLVDIVSEFKRDSGAGPVPFRAVNIEPLGERPEILDLFALTRALFHPADRAAWLAVLRAPWTGLELAQLHLLTGTDDPALAERTLEELLAERSCDLSEESLTRLEKLRAVLRAAAARNSRFLISEWVERTWRSLGGDAYLTDDQMTNAKRYFELLDSLEQKEGIIDLARLKDQLNELYAESVAHAGAVDLITIHGAKGLEWDVVIVPGLDKKSRTSRGRLLTWDEMTLADENAARVLLAPIVGKGRESEALNDWLNGIQRDRENAECRRLFYVACTRAREELHLFGTVAEKTDRSLSSIAGSLLQAAWPAAEEHFVNVQFSAKPLIAPVVMPRLMPQQNFVIPELAAGGDAAKVTPSVLYRVAVDFHPRTRVSTAPLLRGEIDPSPPLRLFERPEGSFEARAFGNAVHVLLEALAAQLIAGGTPQLLIEQVASWDPRITAILRSHGLAPEVAERLVSRVRAALENTLRDPAGLWILSPHSQASSEYALNSWNEARSSVRLDRVFRAGHEPLVSGSDYLWIVDFKTTQHTGDRLEEFLAMEREKYAPQMRAYAREMLKDAKGNNDLRVALYYPLVVRLLWWEPLIE